MCIGTGPFADLPPRLRLLLAPLAEGRTNAAIADYLSLSLHTVEQYVSDIKLAIECRDRVDLVLRCGEFLA